MGHPARSLPRRYTFEDYLSWPEDERWELIHGEAFGMAPSPSQGHQQAVQSLFLTVHQALESRIKGGGGDGPKGPCALFIAPMDVVLGPNTVVQPDLLVVCDPEKRHDPMRIHGAPDLLAEVISPSTSSKDHVQKRDLYEEAGVPEYLIVDPESRTAYLYKLNGRAYGKAQVLGPESELVTMGTSLGTVGRIFGWEAPGD